MPFQIKYSKLLTFAFVLLFCACTGREELGMEEYVRWVENIENGLKKEKKIDQFAYRVFYKPAEYIALRENRDAIENFSPDAIIKRANDLENYYQFNFDIVSVDGQTSVLQHNLSGGQQEYGARINYLISHAQQDFKLVHGQDTLPCINYHFEQTFGLSSLNTIVLGFEKPKDTQKNTEAEEDIQLIFSNRLFNTGDIKFLFSKNKLAQIPRLKL